MANFRPKKPLGGTEPPDTDTLENFLRLALDNLVITPVDASHSELVETDEASPSKQTR